LFLRRENVAMEQQYRQRWNSSQPWATRFASPARELMYGV
jgi:hypothetical protein